MARDEGSRSTKGMVGQTILLAVARQRWERYSAHALAARDVAATLGRGAAGA